MSDTTTNPENVTASAESGDAITAGGYALAWTGLSKGALAEIDRELQGAARQRNGPPDWKRKRHNWKRGR